MKKDLTNTVLSDNLKKANERLKELATDPEYIARIKEINQRAGRASAAKRKETTEKLALLEKQLAETNIQTS